MKNYKQRGDIVTCTAPSGGVTSGVPVLIGAALFGVATATVAQGGSFELQRVGLFTGVPKATGAAWTIGDILYWDPSGKKFTKTSTDNVKAGIAMSAPASGDTTGDVLLTGTP